MRIVDISKHRRSSKMQRFLGPKEYIPVDKDDDWPSADYLLVPGAWWYKAKLAPYATKCHRHGGHIVLMDFGRMFERPRKNETGIRAQFVASAFDKVAIKPHHFPRSLPSLDPFCERERGLNVVVVTSRDDPASSKEVKSLIKWLPKDKFVAWKVRNKCGGHVKGIERALAGREHQVYYSEEKDYNSSAPLLDVLGASADMHINVKRLSWANYEMVRAGVKSYVWDGNLKKVRKLQQFAGMYKGVEQFYCTKNLIRNLRENLNRYR